MAELEAQIQADIAGLEAEFATQQQQILNEENAGAYIEEVSDESRELWKRFEADPLAVIYGTSASATLPGKSGATHSISLVSEPRFAAASAGSKSNDLAAVVVVSILMMLATQSLDYDVVCVK